jgi:hypothetical protein
VEVMVEVVVGQHPLPEECAVGADGIERLEV